MSGKIAQNPNRQSGVIGSIPSATKDSGNPTKTTNPSSGVGTEWINTTSGAIFICTDATTNDNTWVAQTGSPIGIGDRGCWVGGGNGLFDNESSVYNTIDFITITTLGDSTLFGELSARKYEPAGCSNGTNGRGVSGGGIFWYSGISGGSIKYNVMEYVTINTLGNATDLGDMVVTARSRGASSNATNDRGIFWGGESSAGNINSIDYFTITSTGNATDFGNMTQSSRYPSCTDNGTDDRGVAMGGADAHSNVIEYITISSPGNATDFGDLTNSINAAGACSNSTNNRGVVGGGTGPTNVIQYITINSTGNATDFGDLTIARKGLFSAVSNGTDERGIFCSGDPAGAARTRLDYITINSTGNATVFGSMRHDAAYCGGYSDCGI